MKRRGSGRGGGAGRGWRRCCFPAAARADLTVKEQTQMSGMMGMLSSKGTETTYIKGEKMRTESADGDGRADGGNDAGRRAWPRASSDHHHAAGQGRDLVRR